MEEITSRKVEKDVDVTDLERKLNEILHELTQNRASLEDARLRLNTESATKHDLQIEIDRLNRESNDIKVQLEAATRAFYMCEENLNTTKAISVRQKQQLDVALKTNDVLREQAASVQLETVCLQNKIEVLERQLRSNIMDRESCTVKQGKTHTLLETLTVQVRNLEKDRRSFERLTAVATELGNKNKLLVEHNDSVIKYNQEQKEHLSKQVIALSAENDILKKEVRLGEPDLVCQADYSADIMQEWQNSLTEIKARAASEAKESERVHQTLKGALEAQTHLQNLETSACQKIKELESTLQEERELNKKPLCENSFQQTERVAVVDVSCGSESKPLQHCEVQTEQPEQCDIEIQTDLLRGLDRSCSPIYSLTLQDVHQENISLSPKEMLIQKVIGLPLDLESDSFSKLDMTEKALSADVEDISDLPTQILRNNI